MQTLNDIVFIDSLSKLDLHGYDSLTSAILINDFINDSIKQGIEVISIIHGNGDGILRKVTNDTLSKNKNVIEYKQYYYNTGCTIVRIKIWQL